MNGLDLFAGSGIGSLAFRHTIPNYRTVCFVENDPYCQAVLITRIKDGLLEDAPIWGDVRTFDGTKWRGKVGIVSGGFPCQPFSVAGQRKGDADKRNLWPDTARIIGEVRPRYAFLENVPGLLSSGYFETILCDLAKIGYDIEWDVVGASDVGANHRRKRLWILAYPKSVRRRGRSDENGRGGRQIQTPRPSAEDQSAILAESTGTIGRERANAGRTRDKRGGVSETGRKSIQSQDRTSHTDNSRQSSQDVADTTDKRLEGEKPESELSEGQSRLSAECGWWQIEPDVGRVVDELAFRVDRLKMLGNGWIPQVVSRILKVRSLRTGFGSVR